MIKITPMYNFNKNILPNLYFLETDILKKFIKYNFIQKLISSFHDYDNLYLVTKFYEGNNILNYLDRKWTEFQIQFFSASIIQSLMYLRKENLIHRDIHFGNIVFDKEKYISLIDFHITIEYKKKNNPKNDFIGTPLLCAPEMMNHSVYDYNSDYYRLGGMIYFIIFNTFPNIIKKQKNLTDFRINAHEIKNYSSLCIDFINKLLENDYQKRIGFNNIYELINHEWFKNFDWKKFINKQMVSPFINETIKEIDYCKNLYIYQKRPIFPYTNLLKNNTIKSLFINYDKVNDDVIKNIYKKLNIFSLGNF